MPFYEYRCEACGHELEELQKINDPALTKCPECRKNRLTKLVSAAAFKLTGTGWYETDFKNNDKPAKGDKAGGKKESTSKEAAKSKTKKSADSGKKDSKTTKKESKAKKSKSDAK